MRKTSLLFSACFFLQASVVFSQQATKHDEQQAIADTFVLDEVVVSSIRAQTTTPTTYSLVDKSELSKTNLGQDAPYLLQMQPSVVVSSDAGTGIGYTSMQIRGSDNKKINVTINGIPLNDAESHGVYWVDVPDISSSAQSIQIQRGVGTSTNGSGAFGASINILTDRVSEKAYVNYSGALGSFNTSKNALSFSSGLIDKHWFVEGKAGQIKSDGYRDRARADLKNYFGQAGYLGNNNLLKIVAFGGWEETYQAWYGTDKAALDTNRTYNPAGLIGKGVSGKDTFYNDMVDHYQQDHLQLHYAHRFSNELNFNAALHYTYGRGYYQDYAPASWYMPLTGFGLPNIQRDTLTIEYSDIVHRLWLKNHFYGGVFGLNYTTQALSIHWGGGVHNYAPGKHYGEVLWIKEPELTPTGSNYYENESKKLDINTFLKLNYAITDPLSVYADIQLRGIRYSAHGLDREYTFADNTIDIDEEYLFLNPKIGGFYKIDDHTNIYASYAISNREPNRTDFLKAPVSKTPQHETLNDIEIGIRSNHKNFRSECVFYDMEYTNQLVLTGELDSEGTPLRMNVEKSFRRGVELSVYFMPFEKIRFEQNINISANKIVDYPSQDSIGAAIETQDLDIAFSPSTILSQKVSLYPIKNSEISFMSKYVGSQNLDYSQNEQHSLPSYFIFNYLSSYSIDFKKLGKLDIYLMVNNLLNEKYISYGSISYGSPVYFPQAGRNYTIGVNYRF